MKDEKRSAASLHRKGRLLPVASAMGAYTNPARSNETGVGVTLGGVPPPRDSPTAVGRPFTLHQNTGSAPLTPSQTFPRPPKRAAVLAWLR